MNILYYLLEKFLKEEYINTGLLIFLSLTLTLFQTNGISFITAKIIEGIHSKNIKNVFTNYKNFILITIVFFILYYLYKYIQNNLLQKLIQWTRYEIFKLILVVNNENMSSENFTSFFTPISRIAMQLYMLFSNIISAFIPTLTFLLVIFAYFIYKIPRLGYGFLLGNIFIILYIYVNWQNMLKNKNKHETIMNQNDTYIMDILNNIDKVIYRGQTKNEIKIYNDTTQSCINASREYMNYITNHIMFINGIIYTIVILAVGYLIKLRESNEIDIITFITFFTILLLYRDRMINSISELPEYVDFIGRLKYISAKFNKMIGNQNNMTVMMDKKYETQLLEFNTITFENVSFKYENTDKMILTNFNLRLDVNNKIIGIVGLSGKGKSSFAKLLLRLYDCTSGKIFIDDTEITNIDPNYIRQNITYVNQNSKLFDKKVIENIMYGCNHTDSCNENLKEILQYSKIQELFKNVNINETKAGSLGENLSGGQRQVVNILSGLINPSKILILDEPTNALDPSLKSQLLLILSKFKKYKKAIIIITHDKDVHSLFDETVEL